MSAALAAHADRSDDPAAATATASATIAVCRLQQLEACEARCDLDAQRLQVLQTRLEQVEAAYALEQARNENHAEAFMQIARSSDSRVQELKEQHAAVIAAKDAMFAQLHGATAELKAAHRAAIAKLEAENAALKAQIASRLTEIHTVVTTGLQTLEIYPVRPADSRQFATWHNGPVPPLPMPARPVALQSGDVLAVAQPRIITWDAAWAAALAHDSLHSITLDAASGGARASVTWERFPPMVGTTHVTLRGAVPLPRRLPLAPPAAAAAFDLERPQQPVLAAYRIVMEAFRGCADLGFIPSHSASDNGASSLPPINAPTHHHGIMKYGGWFVPVSPSSANAIPDPSESGWEVVVPKSAFGDGADAAALNDWCSAYATTVTVPPVPAGSAVEFAVDYAAGTCRVAFYTPAAVAGGFAELPYAKMELRFVATRAGYFDQIPARLVPTHADARVELYPAVSLRQNNEATVRIVAA